MKKKEMVEYAIRNIRQTSIRSWLTMVGIFIGIMAIVVLIGLAEGLKKDINSELEGFGSNTIAIAPMSTGSAFSQGSAFSTTKGKLFEKDYEKIKKIAGIEYISKSITGRANVEYKDEETIISIFGVEPEVFKQTTILEIEKGRFLEENEYGTAVIGYSVANDGFDKTVEINSKLKIGNKTYKVVGVLKKTGNNFFNPDNLIFINYKNAKELYENVLAKDEISAIRLTVEEGKDIEEISEEIEFVLLSAHKVSEDEKDFTIVTSKYINERIEEITGLLTLFLVVVAGISLVVGGIGISNTMFMNVIERTQEIGILKAIGATKEEVVDLFIIESLIFGVMGGLLGIVIGGIILFGVSAVAGITTVFSPTVAIVSLIFSGLIGVLSGAIPARRASEVSPIEALRYE